MATDSPRPLALFGCTGCTNSETARKSATWTDHPSEHLLRAMLKKNSFGLGLPLTPINKTDNNLKRSRSSSSDATHPPTTSFFRDDERYILRVMTQHPRLMICASFLVRDAHHDVVALGYWLSLLELSTAISLTVQDCTCTVKAHR